MQGAEEHTVVGVPRRASTHRCIEPLCVSGTC